MSFNSIGYLVNNEDDHWIVNCPHCDKEYEFTGYYDPEDETKCECGCVFVTEIPEFIK